MLQDLLGKMRDKNPEGYAQFVHDLAHAIPVEDLESAVEHAKHIQSEHESSDDTDPRAVAIAEALEKTAEEYRNGKHQIEDNTIGVDVQIKQLSKK